MGVRTARENGDSQECARGWMLDQDEIVQKCRSATNFTGCLVFDMPTGETVICSDPRQCRLKLAGISISSEVCT